MSSASRPAWLLVLLAFYAVGALGLAAAVLNPVPMVGADTSPSELQALRVVFAAAAVLAAFIFIGALRRRGWAATLALGLHVVIALTALVFLARAVLDEAALSFAALAELVAKFAVHATLAWIWTRPTVRRAVSAAA